jgi:HemX protein
MLLQTFHAFSRNALSPTAAVALHVAIGGFLLAALVAVAALLLPARVKMRWADWVGGVSTVALVAYFVARFVDAGTEPLQNMFEVVALSALFLALIYFVATRVKKLPSLGGFAYPTIAVIFLVNLMFARTATSGVDAPLSSPLLIAHVVLVILAYGAFLMASLAAIMFLLQERMLKKHKDPTVMRNFPSLESLRRLVNACILIGLPVLTVSFALGFASFTASDWDGLARNPKIISALVLWLVMLGIVIGRRAGWLHGRRHFYMVLVGFLLVLVTYVGLGLVERNRKTEIADSRQEAACSGL